MATQGSYPLHPLAYNDDVTSYALDLPQCDPPAYSYNPWVSRDVCAVDGPHDDCSRQIVDNQPQIRFTDTDGAGNRLVGVCIQQPNPTAYVPYPATERVLELLLVFVRAQRISNAYNLRQLSYPSDDYTPSVGSGDLDVDGPSSNRQTYEAPDDYKCYCKFVKWCCCADLGKDALKRSSECRAAIAAGDYVTAEKKSRQAYKTASIGLCIGIILWIGTLVIGGIGAYERLSAQKKN